MSLWTGVKVLFGAKDTIEAATKAGSAISAGLDKIVWTEEEKDDSANKKADTMLKFWQAIAGENTEQSKARRELAKMVFQVYFFLVLASAAVYPFNAEYAKVLYNYATAHESLRR